MSRRWISVTPTVTAGAYTNNDIVGGRLQFRAVGEAKLETVIVTDNAAQNVNYTLVLFRSVPTDITDNNPFDIADADLDKIIQIIEIAAGTYRVAFTDNSIHFYDGLDLPIGSSESDGDVWGFLIATSGPPTYAATSDITVVLQVS